MSKKKVELIPNDSTIQPKWDVGKVTEVRDDCVIAKFHNASQVLPIYRFIKESDKAKLYVGAKIKVNWYFSISKKLLAYNAELLENE